MRYLLENRIDVLGPDKRFGIVVVEANIVLDCGNQVRHTVKDTSSDTLASDFAEPTFHEIQPR